MSIPEELVESAAKAIHADVCCPADGTDGACAYPNYLWGDRHVARIALEAVADDIRAEALADLAAAHPVPALTRAMKHARRAEDHWAADTVASLVDALTRARVARHPNGCDECRHALNYCDACGYEWPCPTVRTITDALTTGDSND